MTFVEGGDAEIPKWLYGPQARAYIKALRAAQDQEQLNLEFAQRQRFPTHCADDALDVVGAGFLIERFPNETFETYRARLLVAWDTWEEAGTRQAILDSLHAYGITDVEVYESSGDGSPSDPVPPATPIVPGITPTARFAPGSWYSRFLVVLGPNQPWTPMRMSFVLGAPGTLGSSASHDEVVAVKRQALKWKSPHGYPAWVQLYFGTPAVLGLTTIAPFAADPGGASVRWFIGKLFGDTLGNMGFVMGDYFRS